MLLGLLEEVGGIDVLHVERRILAHQYDIELRERSRGGLAQSGPPVTVTTR